MVHKWKMVQPDYILSLPHAPFEKEFYIKIPKWFELDTKGCTAEHVLKLHNNVYGKKQSGRVRYHHLAVKITKEIVFTHYTVDECVLHRGRTILAGPDK